MQQAETGDLITKVMLKQEDHIFIISVLLRVTEQVSVRGPRGDDPNQLLHVTECAQILIKHSRAGEGISSSVYLRRWARQ